MTTWKLIAVLAAIAATLVTASTTTDANHALPDCPASQVHVWMTYKPETYTDDGGHTYGPAATLTCDPNPPNRLHIRSLPSTWTLAQAHNYCAQWGTFAQTNFAFQWYVCPDVDY